MKRMLAWIGIPLALWVGYVWLASHPRFWAGVALTSERISLRAREAYNYTRLAQERKWEKFNHAYRQSPIDGSPDWDSSLRPLPAGNMITDIEEYLRNKRGQ